MPGSGAMGAEAPLACMVVRGTTVLTVTVGGQETEVAACPSTEMALWVGKSLARFHKVELELHRARTGSWAQNLQDTIATELRTKPVEVSEPLLQEYRRSMAAHPSVRDLSRIEDLVRRTEADDA